MLECIVMGIKTQGTLKVDWLLNLPFDEYEFLRKKVEKIKNG